MEHLYDRTVLARPKTVLLSLLALFVFFSYWIQDFRLDASSDSLVLEHDDDLRYYRKISDRYQGGDFLFITYTPREELFAPASLDRLRRLRDELQGLKRISSVVTLLDAPLLKNPPGNLKSLRDNIKSLESPDADLDMAIAEFRDSPIYRDLLVSPDLRSTAVQVNFRADKKYADLLARRAELRLKHFEHAISDVERGELKSVEAAYRDYKDRRRAERHEDIAAIREVIGRYRFGARLFLGGVPMIVDDIISFIKNDLKVFGAGMMCFLVLALGMIFRRFRWVLLPMLCCGLSVVMMMGILGLGEWDVTVVSSNFISLQLIFTMSLAIHIVVRYRELLRERRTGTRRLAARVKDLTHRHRAQSNRTLIRLSVGYTFVPCLYASLTTIAGFSSLVFCDILPVVNFGWMMAMGLCISFIVTFLLLPAALVLMDKPPPVVEKDFGLPITSFFARLTEKRGGAIFAGSAVIAVLTAIGVSRIEVENSFIDYFKESTEIYQGMKFIDQELGGTTPLDVILKFDTAADRPEPVPAAAQNGGDEDFDMFGEFEEEDKEPAKYWFTAAKLEEVRKIHEYLEGLPATGKVLSLATLWETATSLNEGEPFDDFTTALLFNSMPDRFRGILVSPYVSVADNEARITTRIRDSMKSLRRDALIKKIRKDLEAMGFAPERFRVSGLMVLYNNMLQSLFRSQIQTIGFTILILTAMFMALFRSLKIALIAIFPNVLSSMVVLGVMGLAGIPLDVMTITIVAISIGIAVDDTIHYLHRFQTEIVRDRNYVQAMHRCHRSIGNAMYYTSLTISVGFSILAFSSFVPSILFGLLTALAMVMALVTALSLLPRLIIVLKPFGPEL